MTRETMIILKVTGVAGLAFAWCVYWSVKDGLPMWAIGVFALFIVFFAGLAMHGFLPGADEKRAEQLAANAGSIATTGTVLAMRRLGTTATTTNRYSRVGLSVSMTVEGGLSQVELDMRVEDALLPNFASGRTIHLLYDPTDLSRVAVDRRLTPVSVQ